MREFLLLFRSESGFSYISVFDESDKKSRKLGCDEAAGVRRSRTINAHFANVDAQAAPPTSAFDLKNVENFTTLQCRGLPDIHLQRAARKKF
jgi:hypothetical protein